MARMTLSLHRALLAVLAVALLAGLVPAGVVLDWQLVQDLERQAREDLLVAPALLADRNAASADALMMRAKDLAHAAGLATALARDDPAAAERILRGELPGGALPVAVTAGGAGVGPAPEPVMIAATQRGEMPVAVGRSGDAFFRFALAPVENAGRWVGAVGLATPLDATFAGALSGLTRSEVVLLDHAGSIVAATLPDTLAALVVEAAADPPADSPRTIDAAGRRFLVVRGAMDHGTATVFLRDLADVLAPVPGFRRVLVLTGLAALGIALLLGAMFAARVTRPVQALAKASDRVAAGDFSAALVPTAIRELERVRDAFEAMRRALAARLAELQEANRRLAQRESKLTALQAELIQRDRLAASQRLVAELAHEIRNPVANVRNLLEVLHRRTAHDRHTNEFIDMAIDELLRMHELAEHMLDLNRPRDLGAARCDLAAVAAEVARLTRAGAADEELTVTVTGGGHAAVPPDALRQVLFNLVQNARDVVPHGLHLTIDICAHGGVAKVDVTDNGPGIPPHVLPRIFDPFFTTKDTVHGTGLGLFVAEGIVRRYGGRLAAENRDNGAGARFVVELPATGTGEGT